MRLYPIPNLHRFCKRPLAPMSLQQVERVWFKKGKPFNAITETGRRLHRHGATEGVANQRDPFRAKGDRSFDERCWWSRHGETFSGIWVTRLCW
jgi:hypothetical protein